MQALLNDIIKQCRPETGKGTVASYIPELAKANPNDLGICVVTGEGSCCAGDWDTRFSMQSVVKPLILLQALCDSGKERVRNLVGVEATGKPFDAFNYSDQALTGDHINPMINTGAIALCTLIAGDTYEEKFQRLLSLARKLSGNSGMELLESVYISEKATGNKNRALAYMLKAYGMIDAPVEQLIDCYFKACSIGASCEDLARIAAVFANRGQDLVTGECYFEESLARYVNATLATCGMYDGSGEFALNVGIPAKSGVGGGIMGVVPGRMGIGVYAPALDRKGNSAAGVKALELLSQRHKLSVY